MTKKRKMDQKQREFLSKLSKDDRETLASIIIHAEHEGDYTGMDSDGGSHWEESINETLASLAYKIRHFDAKDIHW